MRITENKPVSAVRKSAKKARLNGAGGLFSLDEATDSAPSEAPAKIEMPMAVGDISTLLAVQENLGEQQKTGAINRGFDTLDALDALKIDVLSGNVSRQKLVNLSALVEKQRSNLSDPALMNLLDHIELRARVELAKFDQNRS
jgi:Class II flagellar assembly regulator